MYHNIGNLASIISQTTGFKLG